ncbi:phosphatidylglycerophosphatase [Lactobacillus phage LpeD]|uniref:Phosphatidylglycerophosphatase n=1 Tax=Lactobacillus phage LpeD TaxID=2041210 RepID=A0A291I9Q0_9CAUD|nr:phosphatidylglycerophosphatase A [Lactobacillus phage LpeD]ATG86404.1 phosphatidylglycerophosphatase [Lactobacillus phage LpeD]
MDKGMHYPDKEAFNFVEARLSEIGVSLKDIAKIVYDLEHKYLSNLSLEDCLLAVTDVVHKREVLNNAMVGLELDRLAQEGQIKEPLLSIIKNDVGVFGVDEVLGIAISQLYGSIGVTNYGFADKEKSGIIKSLDTSDTQVNTFSDDLVGAIASAASAKVAHENS